MTQCLELARPMVRRAAGFDTDKTWRQLLEERQDGRLLLTLKDAATFIMKLPRAEHSAPEWQAAMEA